MGAKLFVGRTDEPVPPGETPEPASQVAPDARLDPELEAEVEAVAAWFVSLPPAWQRYFDEEAKSGRSAYGRA